MRSADEVHVVFVQELGNNIRAEGEGDTTVIFAPARHVFIRVSPQQVTQQPLIRHICGSHQAPDLLHRLQVWRQA